MAARPDPRTLVAPPAVRVGGAAPPPPAAVRMDVAAFVGRVRPAVPPAPLPPPAAVESAEAFAAAFAEAPDSRLGPAVRAFFRNGGRRCWVVPAEPPFLDGRLKTTGAATLVREAVTLDDGPPTGVHAVLALEEVTLLAVPDAFPPRAATAAAVRDTAVAAPPGMSAAPLPGFSTCKVVDPAVLGLTFTRTSKPPPDAPNPPPNKWVELAWKWAVSSPDPETAKGEAAARAGARFVLVRSASPAFPPNETETVYRGPATGVSVGTEPAFYRVRAETVALTGGWAVPVEQALPTGDVVKTLEDPVATQIAAVQVCAARGDMLAVLAPPENWPTITDDEWLRLRTKVTADAVAKGDWIGLLRKSDAWTGSDSGAALQSHAAFWGPWVLARDGERADAEPDAYPADGAVCGLLARRALERGAWASILNLPVAGALGLGPPPYGPGDLVPLYAAEAADAPRAASDSREAVTVWQGQGINVLARTPRGFVAVGERTPPDPRRDAGFPSDVVPVRRFMALLRRELARVGVGLAFLPNGPALERRAARAVEAVLEGLLRRGALVGPDARSSFQVTARAGEPGGAGESSLAVEVRVRPALPLRLLTLQLVRTGADAFTVAEGHG